MDEDSRKQSSGYAMLHYGDVEHWNHFSQSRWHSERYSGGEVFEVLVQEDAQGDHVAWWNNEKQQFTRLDWDAGMIRICFPGPLALHESRGEGKLLRVRVSKLTR